MTDTTTPQSHVEGSESPSEAEPQNGSEKPMPREQRYRLELRAAEAARDALAQRVEAMQRAEVQRLAADALSHPEDLFTLSGSELAAYLTDEGDVDPDKVAADIAAILADRPGLQKQKHPAGYDPSQGHGGSPGKGAPTFADLLR